jgi:putative Ca2+/H+ antiporter (TMEM165/GDT1 family)
VLLRWVLAGSFLAMAMWILIPDKLDEASVRPGRFGIFGATLVAFFIAEMGDKTQLATVALAAKYSAFYTVVAGTTAGMLLANVPVVLLGDRLAKRVPAHIVRKIAAALFVSLGVLAFLASAE